MKHYNPAFCSTECTHDAWYKTYRLWIALLIGILVLVAGTQAYRAGSKAGYSQGWMDANCGKGNACEGGQE